MAQPNKGVWYKISLHLVGQIVVCEVAHWDGIHKDLQRSFNTPRRTVAEVSAHGNHERICGGVPNPIHGSSRGLSTRIQS